MNIDTLIDNFAVVVETDTPTKGSWQLDYESFCTKFNIVRCPNISSVNTLEDKECCKAINAIIDLSNWRAMLLACCTTGSKVVEISVHGCQLSAQHFVDLAAALKKMGSCQSLKLQYLDWQNTDLTDVANNGQLQEALTLIFSDTCCLEGISLKGNNFTSDFLAPIITSLSQNFKLIYLNLANNLLDDSSVLAFLKAIRCCTNIKYVSFASNQTTGEHLSVLAQLLNGTEQSAEDDATIKANSKSVGDKNKAIKELNKKRKKAGQSDIREIPAVLDVAIKREKTMFLINRILKRLDFSNNALMKAECVEAFAQCIAEAPQGLTLSQAAATYQLETDPKLVLDFTGCSSAVSKDVNVDPQAWIHLAL